MKPNEVEEALGVRDSEWGWTDHLIEETVICNRIQGNSVIAEIIIRFRSPDGGEFEVRRHLKMRFRKVK